MKNPPLLSSPMEGKTLYMYLSATDEAVSSALVRMTKNGHQNPIYYISKVLHEAEVRYPRLQKLIYSLIVAVKRLQPYFQAHSTIVLTDQPLKAVLMSPDTFGRMAKWAVRLEEFDISFRPRSALKAQVIADFIAECT